MTARLVQIAEQIGMPQDQCDDVAQEALLQALEQSEKYPGEYSLDQRCSWLALVGYHRAVDALRDIARHSCQSLEKFPMEPMGATAAYRKDTSAWIEYLSAMLARLQQEEPENCRLVCQHYLERKSIKALAHTTGWTANEVRCRIYRAMEKLRSWAPEFCPHAEDAS